jgi:SAM-dependent methyltransferase
MDSIYRRYAEAYVKSGHGRWSLQLVPWAIAVLERYGAAPASLVDVACGPGEFACAMAQRGYAVTGVDQSPEMLAMARTTAARLGVAVAFLQQDMRALRLDRPADVLTCLFDSLNYLVDERDFRRTVEAFARGLSPRGLLLFDMNTLRGMAGKWSNRTWLVQDVEEEFEVHQTEFDYDSGVATIRINAFLQRDGRLYERIQEVHRERGYPMHVIDGTLAAHGFEILGRWSTPEFGEVTPETGRVFYAARRGPGDGAPARERAEG